jgi:hypothetical protein
MDVLLSSEFELVATSIAALAFPKTHFQLFSKKLGKDNLAITFKSETHFSENFRIRFFPKLKTLTLSGYSTAGMSHLNYMPTNNYDWFDSHGYKITAPSDIGEKLEFLAKKFYPFLEEFFLG